MPLQETMSRAFFSSLANAVALFGTAVIKDLYAKNAKT